jgi:HAD superfamily hydrolase (TIGR01450 family)
LQTATIDDLIERYDALLFDAYGVLVHVSGPMPGAPELIARLNDMQKPYCVVTNDASRLPEKTASQYRRYGLEVDAGQIITSGMLLQDYFAKHRLRDARCVVLGPTDSRRYVELAGGEVVAPDEWFDVLVIGDESGFAFLDTVDTALSTLFKMLDGGRHVHLVLPNPDLIYPSGVDSFGIAAGGVALLFEAALQRRYRNRQGLEFARLGKPYPHLYEAAMARCDTRDVVMIGDQLETDIAGAKACGIDSALLTTGVSRDDVALIPEELRPTWRVGSLDARD